MYELTLCLEVLLVFVLILTLSSKVLTYANKFRIAVSAVVMLAIVGAIWAFVKMYRKDFPIIIINVINFFLLVATVLVIAQYIIIPAYPANVLTGAYVATGVIVLVGLGIIFNELTRKLNLVGGDRNTGSSLKKNIVTDDEAPFATSCYAQQFTEDLSADPSVVINPYKSNDRENTYVKNQGEIGPVYGLAYRPESDDLFASNFYKRATRLPQSERSRNSLDIIYRIEGAKNSGPSSTQSQFIRLDDFFGQYSAGYSGSDIYSFNGSDTNITTFNFIHEDAVKHTSKKGFGDIDISNDGEYLYAVNLFDRHIYRIKTTGSDGETIEDYKAGDSRDIGKFDILAMTGIMTSPPTASPGSLKPSPEIKHVDNIRPFALKWYNGRVYIGILNTEEYKTNGTPHSNLDEALVARENLFAYVYSFDGFNESSIRNEIAFSLAYNRPEHFYLTNSIGDTFSRIDGIVRPVLGSPFMPWSENTDIGGLILRSSGSVNLDPWVNYTQPILSDIEFLNDNMVLGFRDRLTDQLVSNTAPNLELFPSTVAYHSVSSAGDTLNSKLINGVWEIEPLNPAPLEESDKFFSGDSFIANDITENAHHTLISQGALAVSRNRVISTALDPMLESEITIVGGSGNGLFSGGFVKFDINSGNKMIGESSRIYNDPLGFAAKGTNLGDLEMLVTVDTVKYRLVLRDPPTYNERCCQLVIRPEIVADCYGDQCALQNAARVCIKVDGTEIPVTSMSSDKFGCCITVCGIKLGKCSCLSFCERDSPSNDLHVPFGSITQVV